MLLTSLPVTPPYPSPGYCGVATYHAVIRRRFSKSQFVKNIGVFDSPWVRFCILSSSSGTSPASPASSASAPAKDADDANDAGDVAHAGEGTSGNEGERISTGKGGERSQGGKGEDLGNKCLWGGKGRNDLNRERGGKDLREEREKIWGKKGQQGPHPLGGLSGQGQHHPS